MTPPPGLVISASASGSGKTTVALGLARAFRRRGLVVQAYKSGPDYIDPAFLAAAAGGAAFNVDSWAMPADLVGAILGRAATADVAIAEGAMGLFDGAPTRGAWGTGATADLAARTGWPVILVVDPAAQAQTAAAAAKGLADFRANVRVAGVILNRIASPRHEALVRAGFSEAGLRVFGALPRSPGVATAERHLGLVQAGEKADLEAMIERAADLIERHLDLDAVLAAARPMTGAFPSGGRLPRAPAARIALARDIAFSFVYPHVLAGWRADGATILPFSPLADEPPDPTADLCWLPGGYPELHAGRLAGAERFRAGLAAFAATRPVHGECGGYMVLGAGLVDAEGVRRRMTGLLGLETSFATRSLTLGYRRAILQAPIPGHAAGAVVRGHEFRYATVLAQPDDALATIADAAGAAVPETGSRRGAVSGTFLHLVAEEAR
ncbi:MULTISPECIES: cobyrinate a,c-diamide synthase [Methylosinus]|uniref:Hydrogenobyrinate a,c-diamide synthase n=1 Tax=Methylosinus trichosporium (strain ATCC 35070 / NCIMB 11131 / UNIQEM 75 / OB3b) TaxID=595536 RepID=A0A2D2CZD9_METT3|nr:MULTISPECIES: cobyrinate a,c-diamide synthase [Methylosinus]ATQ68113.1 cobyrinate a,c-diamide synthase [Methylosinus trichosporium OB3b]OBS53500.1 cobyrinic acid a,c-diamide synthase [Methylosinus sp. 3S-1]